jgi:pimeloyl-ACP methyl ester carboxylesterase
MVSLEHRSVACNGIRLHAVEAGEGPLVIFVHGFPECWYSWRYQLGPIAEAGYRAVAIDVRGYGRSSRPWAVEEYRLLSMVADVVGLVGALGEERATLVGHDWGAPTVWTSALLRPDLFDGVAGMSVTYPHLGAQRPSELYRAVGGDEEFYISYFQEEGRAEAEAEPDVRGWLLGFFHGASGDAPRDARPISHVTPGERLRDRFLTPDPLPDWLSEEDLEVYAGEFERTGFRGALNRYRNVDRDWEDMAALGTRPIEIPALYLGGERDGPTNWGRESIDRFPERLPKLHRCEIFSGCGHWIQHERAEETNEALLDFLDSIHGRS